MKKSTISVFILFSALILVNLPVYGLVGNDSNQVSINQFLNSLDRYKQMGSLVSEDHDGSELDFMPTKTVIWYNDLNSPVTISSKLFDNVTLQQAGTFSYKFSTPGVYWIHFNDTNKQEINVEDIVNDCTIQGGCGHSTDPTICEQFGQPDNTGKCNDTALANAAKAEFDRRNNVTKQTESEINQKTSQVQQIQVQLDSLRHQFSSMDREKLGEAEYMKEYDGLQNQMEPLENQINQLNDEIRTLQNFSPTYSCVKDSVKFFVCSNDVGNTNVGRVGYTTSNSTTTDNNASLIPLNNTNTPKWVQKVFSWYEQGQMSDDQLKSLVQWLIDNKIMGK